MQSALDGHRDHPSRSAAAHEPASRTDEERKLRMARRHRRRQHGRRLRADHPFVARAQGKPRPVHAARFSAAGQRALARGQRHEAHRERLSLRAASLRSAVLPAGFCRPATISRWPGELDVRDIRRRAPARPDASATTRWRRAMHGLRIGEIVDGARAADPSGGRALSGRSRCPTANGCACSTRSTGSPRTRRRDLAYRWFCGSKMCGTCAVRMNGREVLACWEAVEPDMTIEPLRNLPVVRDLVVDRAPFERKVAELEPWLERPDAYAGLSRAALAQGDEGRLEGARLHRLHVLLLGLPGDRAGRSHRFRRPRAARPARPDRARSAQRSRQRSRARSRSPAFSTASPATSARRCARRASRSSAGSSSR